MKQNQAIVIAAHGSRNPRWVAALREWEAGFRRVLGELSAPGEAPPSHLTFLEMTEPLYSETLRRLDGQFERLAILPLFLTKSSHGGVDVPHEAAENLRRSAWSVVRTDDLPALLGANAARRLREGGARPGDPVVVSGYGASAHGHLWEELTGELRAHAGPFGSAEWRFAPAGHFLDDSARPLREALEALLTGGIERASILPLYVAVSSYQEELIPAVVREFPSMHVAVGAPSLLPDPAIEQWAARAALRTLSEGVFQTPTPPPGKEQAVS